MGIVTMQMLMMNREKKKEEKNKKQNSPERKRGGGEEQYKDTMTNIKCLFSMSSCPLPPNLNKHPHSSTL